MSTTIWNLLNWMAAREGGRWCRVCGDSVSRKDEFGRSEGVCEPCRVEVTA